MKQKTTSIFRVFLELFIKDSGPVLPFKYSALVTKFSVSLFPGSCWQKTNDSYSFILGVTSPQLSNMGFFFSQGKTQLASRESSRPSVSFPFFPPLPLPECTHTWTLSHHTKAVVSFFQCFLFWEPVLPLHTWYNRWPGVASGCGPPATRECGMGSLDRPASQSPYGDASWPSFFLGRLLYCLSLPSAWHNQEDRCFGLSPEENGKNRPSLNISEGGLQILNLVHQPTQMAFGIEVHRWNRTCSGLVLNAYFPHELHREVAVVRL